MGTKITSRMAICPHCGTEVYFSGTGMCPSCREDSAAPVTEAHLQKIQDTQDHKERRGNFIPRKPSLVWGLVCIALGIGLSAISFTLGHGGYVFYGLVIYGIYTSIKAIT